MRGRKDGWDAQPVPPGVPAPPAWIEAEALVSARKFVLMGVVDASEAGGLVPDAAVLGLEDASPARLRGEKSGFKYLGWYS